MQKFLTLMSGLILTLSVSANDDYEQVLKRYDELKPTAEEILVLTNFVTNEQKIRESVILFDNGSGSELKKIHNINNAIRDKTEKLGDVFMEPYARCVQMAKLSSGYFESLRTNAYENYELSDSVLRFREEYKTLRNQCKDAVNNKPIKTPKKDLAIIDVS